MKFCPGTYYTKNFPLYSLHSHVALFWRIFPHPAATQILSELAPSTWAEGLWLPSGLGNPHTHMDNIPNIRKHLHASKQWTLPWTKLIPNFRTTEINRSHGPYTNSHNTCTCTHTWHTHTHTHTHTHHTTLYFNLCQGITQEVY